MEGSAKLQAGGGGVTGVGIAGTLENPEPRYTLECYPALIIVGSALFGKSAFAGPLMGKLRKQAEYAQISKNWDTISRKSY